MNRKLFRCAVAAVALMVAVAASADDRIVEPGQVFAGKSYSELASEWTNWLTKEPIATNPAFDPDGSLCGANQDGKVWFLASTFGGIVDRPCLSMATDLERVRYDVNNDVPVAPNVSFEATLDGVAVADLFAYRAQSQTGGFTLQVPDPSFLTDLGFPAGDRSPAVADGYFLFLKPLKTGAHTLNFRLINPDQSEAGVNYTLIVQ